MAPASDIPNNSKIIRIQNAKVLTPFLYKTTNVSCNAMKSISNTIMLIKICVCDNP